MMEKHAAGKLCVIVLFFALPPFSAYCETGIGFADAAKLAVENSSELRNEYTARALREGAWIWGVRAYLPRLGISASEDDRVSETGADSFMKNYSVSLDQLLWDGGRLSLSRKIEKTELELAGSKLRQTASGIAEAVVSAYRDVLKARMFLEIRKKTAESLDEQRRILRHEADLGLVLPSELSEAEITVALAELEVVSLSLDLEEAEWRLAEKLGLEKLPPLSERIDTTRIPRLPVPSKAGAFAESRNLDLVFQRYAIARRQAEAGAASHSWVPTLRLTGTFGLSGMRYPLSRYSWSLGLSVDFSSPWVSGTLGASAGRDPPYDRNARIHNTLNPAPDPGAVFSTRQAELALALERQRYETILDEIITAAERGVKNCLVLDEKRVLALNALDLEGEKFRLAELKLSLGQITRVELMEARLDYAKREAALVEAAAAVLEAERKLEQLLDLAPGELSSLAEMDAI